MAKTDYTPLNLPKSLVEEMKIWRMAFCTAYGRTVSYAEMIRNMLNSLEHSEPPVYDEMCEILEKHPDLARNVAATCSVVKSK